MTHDLQPHDLQPHWHTANLSAVARPLPSRATHVEPKAMVCGVARTMRRSGEAAPRACRRKNRRPPSAVSRSLRDTVREMQTVEYVREGWVRGARLRLRATTGPGTGTGTVPVTGTGTATGTSAPRASARNLLRIHQ